MLINENQLDAWVRGNARDAQELIVELVWRLVATSCPKPRERRFPLGDSIGQHGPDGVLDVALSFESFVPEGRSYWEIGTGLKACDKATSDYNDLTKAVPKNVRIETTFVFVTPLSGRRDWDYTWKKDAQASWLNDHRNRDEWKDVRIIDGTKLIEWVRQFPTLELWLVQKITGMSAGEIETLEQHWSLLKSIGEPLPLITDLFLANRAEARAKLKEVFDGTITQLKLITNYPNQVIDFVSAYLASLDDESRVEIAGRCLIVSGEEAWSMICPQYRNLILVADFAPDLSGDRGTKLIQKALKAGHAIIFGRPQGGIPDPMSVPFPMPRRHQVQEELEKAGYTEERARALSQKSGGNLTSLLRCLQNLSVMPEWTQWDIAGELAIAMFLGSWSDKSDADRAVVEKMSGKAYEEWIGKMREVALRTAAPLIQRDGKWKFIPRYEGWYALAPRLYDEHLERLKSVAVSVLREKDPQFELPPEERYAASIHGKVLSHSRTLRNGLAESLALLGSHPQALTSCSIDKVEATVVQAVREILADADWVLWASLDDLLPLLAEATPSVFLDAVEMALRSDSCPFDELFAQESAGVFGRTYMSDLLWALETLAWDADYLNRVLNCLGELDARDSGGQWANRPANSLTTILLPWLPQTCAPIPKRVTAVRTLLTELPKIGWKLIVSLLPQHHSVSSRTHKPAWRATIPDSWREGVTYHKYWEQVSAYAELAINEAKKDVLKLTELIDHLENLPKPEHEQLLDYLSSDAVMAIPEEERLCLWNKLDKLVTKHRKFADAKWAMKPDQIDKIAAFADRLTPESPFFRHQRLFSERDFNLYDEKGNYEEQMKELNRRRQKATQEVAASGGVKSVIKFAQVVESPWRVGFALGTVANPDEDSIVLPSLIESEQRELAQFAGGYVRGRISSGGWEWVDSIEFSELSPIQIGQFLSLLPFTPETWEHAKQLLGDDQSDYWSKTSANPFEAKTGLELAIDQLIQNGRPYAAIRCLNKMLHDNQPIGTRQAVRALLEAIKSTETRDSEDVYDTVEIIKALQNDPRTNTDDLFQVEWAYLPLLDGHHGAMPKLLWRRLADNPAFFCEVIRLVFRSKKEERPAEEVIEKRKNIATNASRLLRGWRTPPGLCEEGSYDGNSLKAWLSAVKKECTETGHLEIAMTMVGHVLIYVPADPDGLWIHHSAAAVLNAKDAGNTCNGFRTELFNSRGVHWVDPTGKPERELATKYREQANAVENAGYYRFASTLRELADTYEREYERMSSKELLND